MNDLIDPADANGLKQPTGSILPGVRRRPPSWLIIVAAALVGVLVFFGVQSLLNLRNAPQSAPSVIEPSSAYDYVSDDYGFAAQFPSEPTETTQDQSVLAFTITLLSVQWVNADTFYQVGAAVMPPEVSGQDVDVFLENSIGGAASASGGTISDKKTTTLDGEQALEATLTYSNGQLAHIIVALHDGTQYSLIVSAKDTDRVNFVNSFQYTS